MPSTQTPPAKLDPGCPWTYCLQYHALQTMMKDAIVRVDLTSLGQDRAVHDLIA
jgi:hypothetical protein